MANIGDKVKVVMKDKTEAGILMPSRKDNIVVLKLDNGYNIGIDNNNIKKIEVVEKKKEQKVTNWQKEMEK